MKKKLSILIIIIAFILGIGMNVNASQIQEYSSKDLSYYQENPLYASENITYTNKFSNQLKMNKKAITKHSVPIQSYQSNTGISINIRDYMVQRTTSFNLYGKLILNEPINNSNFRKYIENVIQNAMSEELANSSSAGDYLKWSWGNYNVSVSSVRYQKIGISYTYYLDLVFNFNYYTTYSQEIELNNDIKTYINHNIDVNNDTAYEKIYNIYAYITSNVRYDYTNLEDSTYMLKYTAYAAMENKTAVCQGYAALFYKMVRESGIKDVRIITSSTHAWNIAKMGVMYYNLDATWDEGRSSYDYFLRGSNIFNRLNDHTRDLEYTTTTFRKKYPTSSEDYNANRIYHMNKCVISNLQSVYTYTSQNIIPKMTIAYEDYILSEGKDYTIKCENNIMPGIAKIEIKGLGYFEGIISKTFNIIPAKMTGLKVSKNYTKQINLKWTKQSGVTGYKLYKYNSKSKKYECIKTLSGNTTSYNVKKLSAGDTYRFKIRSYKDTGNGQLYGEDSGIVNTATLPNKVTISSVKTGSKKLTAKWKKVSVCTGYEIQYSTNSKFKASKTKKVMVNGRKSISKTIKKLKRRQKYYVRVRAYTTVSGKKYYGSYSKVKTVRVR